MELDHAKTKEPGWLAAHGSHRAGAQQGRATGGQVGRTEAGGGGAPRGGACRHGGGGGQRKHTAGEGAMDMWLSRRAAGKGPGGLLEIRGRGPWDPSPRKSCGPHVRVSLATVCAPQTASVCLVQKRRERKTRGPAAASMLGWPSQTPPPLSGSAPPLQPSACCPRSVSAGSPGLPVRVGTAQRQTLQATCANLFSSVHVKKKKNTEVRN